MPATKAERASRLRGPSAPRALPAQSLMCTHASVAGCRLPWLVAWGRRRSSAAPSATHQGGHVVQRYLLVVSAENLVTDVHESGRDIDPYEGKVPLQRAS